MIWTGSKVLIEACHVNKPPITPRAKRLFIVVIRVVAVALGHISVCAGLVFTVAAVDISVFQVLTHVSWHLGER
jgi:hypothetical protein